MRITSDSHKTATKPNLVVTLFVFLIKTILLVQRVLRVVRQLVNTLVFGILRVTTSLRVAHIPLGSDRIVLVLLGFVEYTQLAKHSQRGIGVCSLVLLPRLRAVAGLKFVQKIINPP